MAPNRRLMILLAVLISLIVFSTIVSVMLYYLSRSKQQKFQKSHESSLLNDSQSDLDVDLEKVDSSDIDLEIPKIRISYPDNELVTPPTSPDPNMHMQHNTTPRADYKRWKQEHSRTQGGPRSASVYVGESGAAFVRNEEKFDEFENVDVRALGGLKESTRPIAPRPLR